MRIYRERIPGISRQIVGDLVSNELIEVESEQRSEVELDIESVLNEYRRSDRELTERARDLISMRGLDYSHLHKVRAQLAREKGFGLGEDAIEWLTQQMLEMLLQSRNVEEVFGEDHELRKVIGPVLKKELSIEGKMDVQVKKRIQNLTEGTADYEIEYQKTLEALRQSKNLSGND